MRYMPIIFSIWQIFAISAYIFLCHAEAKSENFSIMGKPKILEDIMKQSHMIEPSMKNFVVPLFKDEEFKGVAENSLIVLYQNTLKILEMFHEKAKALTHQYIESLFLIEPIKEQISKEDFKIWLYNTIRNAEACTDKDGFFSIKDAVKRCPLLVRAFIDVKDTSTPLGIKDKDTPTRDADSESSLFTIIDRISEAYEIGMNAIAERTIEFISELGIFDVEDGHLLMDETLDLLPSVFTENTFRASKPTQSSLLYTDETIQNINQFEIDVDREKDKVLREIRLLLGFHQFKYDLIIVKKAVEKVGLEHIKQDAELSNKLLTQQESHVVELLKSKIAQIEQIVARYKQRIEELFKALTSKLDATTFKSFTQRFYKYISDGLFKGISWFIPTESPASTRRLSMYDVDSSQYSESIDFSSKELSNVPQKQTLQQDIISRNIEEKLKTEIPVVLQQSVQDAFPENHMLAGTATVALRNFQTRIESLYQILPFEFLAKNNLSHILNNTALLDVLDYIDGTVAKRWEDLPLPSNTIQSIKSDSTVLPFETFIRKLDELNRVFQHNIEEAIRNTISQLSRIGISLSSSDITKLDQIMQSMLSQYVYTPPKSTHFRRLEQDQDDDALLLELIRSIIDIMEDYESAIQELEEKLVENADISVVLFEYFKKHDPDYLKEIQAGKNLDISKVTGERRKVAEDAVDSIIHIYRGHLKALRAEILSIVEDNKWIIDTLGWERIEVLQEKLENMLNELTPQEAF